MDKDLHQKLDALPDKLKKEVEQFVDSLLSGKKPAKVKNKEKRTPKFGSGKGMFKLLPEKEIVKAIRSSEKSKKLKWSDAKKQIASWK